MPLAVGEWLVTAPVRPGTFEMERVKGIEPSFSAWEADVLPLNYTRSAAQLVNNERLFRRHNDLPGADKAARNHERVTFSDGDRMS